MNVIPWLFFATLIALAIVWLSQPVGDPKIIRFPKPYPAETKEMVTKPPTRFAVLVAGIVGLAKGLLMVAGFMALLWALGGCS